MTTSRMGVDRRENVQVPDGAPKRLGYQAIAHFFAGFDTDSLPQTDRVVYADGSAGSSFRPGFDLELSHWIPTTTPKRWAADTSTEICVRFVEDAPEARYELAVNNHIDIDGMLSLFVLLHPDIAIAHRDVIVGAAEHSDLQATAPRAAVVLAQELTPLVERAYIQGEPLQDLYEEGFTRAKAILDGSGPKPGRGIEAWEQIERGHRLIDEGIVTVRLFSDRLAGFVLPQLGADDISRALTVPAFSVKIDHSAWLWPHARNRDHGEKAHLVSIPFGDGWFHDLWLPGYIWANTPDRWRVPGLHPTGGSNEWSVDNTAFTAAIEELTVAETGDGSWIASNTLTPFSALAGRGFPVVASFVDSDQQPTISSLHPDVVGMAFARVFDEPQSKPQSNELTGR